MPSTAVERVWGSRLLMTTSNEQYGYKVRETATTAAHPGVGDLRTHHAVYPD